MKESSGILILILLCETCFFYGNDFNFVDFCKDMAETRNFNLMACIDYQIKASMEKVMEFKPDSYFNTNYSIPPWWRIRNINDE